MWYEFYYFRKFFWEIVQCIAIVNLLANNVMEASRRPKEALDWCSNGFRRRHSRHGEDTKERVRNEFGNARISNCGV
jgi:hypothetical protein